MNFLDNHFDGKIGNSLGWNPKGSVTATVSFQSSKDYNRYILLLKEAEKGLKIYRNYTNWLIAHAMTWLFEIPLSVEEEELADAAERENQLFSDGYETESLDPTDWNQGEKPNEL